MPADTLTLHDLRAQIRNVAAERDIACRLVNSTPAERRALVGTVGLAAQRIARMQSESARTETQFRTKLKNIAGQLDLIGAASAERELQTVHAQSHCVAESLRALAAAPGMDGDDLLPLTPEIEAVCTQAWLLSGITGIAFTDESAEIRDGDAAGEPSRLATALRRLAESSARELGREVELNCQGLADIPEAWQNSLFDVTCQLLRNAIEHGIESPAERKSAGKSAAGKIEISFTRTDRGAELLVYDDGRGLDSARIAKAAKACGSLPGRLQSVQPRDVVRMIFLPGLSTAEPNEGRGHGMKIVRDQLKRLGGKISVATRNGQYTRIEISFAGAPATTQTK